MGLCFFGSLPAGKSPAGWLEMPKELGEGPWFFPTVEVLESGVSCCMPVSSSLKFPQSVM